jgi:hypothetical protein
VIGVDGALAELDVEYAPAVECIIRAFPGRVSFSVFLRLDLCVKVLALWCAFFLLRSLC